MQLKNFCTDQTFAWEGSFFRAYHIVDDSGEKKTVFRYDIPYEKGRREEIHFFRYNIRAEERQEYYSRLAQAIQRQVSVSNRLKTMDVPSVLTYEAVRQEKEESVTSVYLQTEKVVPITMKLLREQIDMTTLLNIFIRLSVVVRDMAKCGLSHRGIDLNEVYLTEDNKILLGGFYYAVSSEYSEIIPYLPEQRKYLPPELLEGKVGSAATDMQTISRILYNICAGVPWDAQWEYRERMIAPGYAPEELVRVIQFGRNCTDAECNAFRRQLLDCRKNLAKTQEGAAVVPIRKPLLCQLSYE